MKPQQISRRADFTEALKTGRLLLMDGATGSELIQSGLKPGECFEAWNLLYPERIENLHRAYVQAGAECLLTNTFQANPQALARHGREGELEEINRRAIELARAAAGAQLFVLASIGPMDLSRGTGDLSRVLRSLAEADGWLLETWSQDFELALSSALDPAVNPERVPVLVSLTYLCSADEPSLLIPPAGMSPSEAARRASAFGIAALGVNCGRDLDLRALKSILKAYRTCTDLPLLVRPNAGTPVETDGHFLYPRSAEEMTRWIPELIAAGAQLIGGCCGTTPAHIASFRKEIDKLQK